MPDKSKAPKVLASATPTPAPVASATPPAAARPPSSAGYPSNEPADALTPDEYLDRLFHQPDDPRVRLELPGYAFYQGVVVAEGNVRVTGPVRVIGGLVLQPAAPGKTPSLARVEDGAMLTTNPEYAGRLGMPIRTRLHIVNWSEN